MGITVNGTLIVKGDQLNDDAVKIVHNHGGGNAKKEPLTVERLKENVDAVLERIENGRLWFSVCKYMMWENLCADGDFVAAVEILKPLYPDVAFNAKDLASLNVMSFRKPLAQWDANDCPMKDLTTYNKYHSLAMLLTEM